MRIYANAANTICRLLTFVSLAYISIIGILFTESRKMRKRFIRFSHAVHVIAFFDGVAGALTGIKKNSGKFKMHGLAGFVSGRANNPTEG